jgi:hypothetical protein
MGARVDEREGLNMIIAGFSKSRVDSASLGDNAVFEPVTRIR